MDKIDLSPTVAFVLLRLLRDGNLPQEDIDPPTQQRLSLLASKELAVELPSGAWEPTARGQAADTSNAIPDAYEIISTQVGWGGQFSATRDGKTRLFEVVEHANIGRGWLLSDLQSNEIVSEKSLLDIKPISDNETQGKKEP